MTETKKVIRISPETHKRIKMVAVNKEMKLYQIVEDILNVYSKEMLRKQLEEMLGEE